MRNVLWKHLINEAVIKKLKNSLIVQLWRILFSWSWLINDYNVRGVVRFSTVTVASVGNQTYFSVIKDEVIGND